MSESRSVGELVEKCKAAMQRMSAKNPHREVLRECVIALTDLAVQLHNRPAIEQRSNAGLILVGDQ